MRWATHKRALPPPHTAVTPRAGVRVAPADGRLNGGGCRIHRWVNLVVGVALVFGSACSTLGRPSCTTNSALVEDTISAKVRELDGTEYCQFRRYHTLDDLDGAHVNDLIVLFNVEGIGGGGNDVLCFMAVFLSQAHWKPVVVQTGERGVRLPVDITVRGHTIVLRTMEYEASDALCCPSGKGELTYEIVGGVVRRISQGGGG